MLCSCNYEDVEVREIKKLSIHRLDKSGIDFSAKLYVENPNGYRIVVSRSDADLYLANKHAGKAHLKEAVVVPARFRGEVEAHVRTDFDSGSLSLLPVIISSGLKRRVELRAAGDIRARSFLIGKKLSFDYSHEATF